MSKLTEKWVEVALPLVAYFQEGPGLRKWQFGDSGIPFLNIRTFDQGRLDKSLCRFVQEEEFKGKYEHFLLNEGDIVVSSSGTLGKLILIHKEDLPVMLNTSTIRFRTLDESIISQNYLRYWLQSKHFFRQIDQAKTGSAILNYGPSHLKEMKVQLPPPNEQKRIVAKLDELLPKVEACKQRLEKIPTILKRFRQSVLAAAVSGRLTNEWRLDQGIDETSSEELPAKWRTVPLREVVTKFSYGTSAKSEKEGKVPVLRMGNIQNGEIDWSDLVYSNDEEEIKKYTLTKNTVLFNRTNSPELVGKTAIYRGERPAIFAGYLIKAVAGSELNPDYLNLCLNAPFAREWCREVKSDGVSQSNINAQKLADFLISLPPLEEQDEIVNYVRAQSLRIEKVIFGSQKALDYASRVHDALLAQAFSGYLVPQEPTDEPASVLLERIKSLAASPTLKKAPSRRRKAGNDPESIST